MNMATGNLRLDKQLARWYPLKDHPVQCNLVTAVSRGVRFPLVPAGRRSGKTEMQEQDNQAKNSAKRQQELSQRCAALAQAEQYRAIHEDLQTIRQDRKSVV